MIVRSLDNLGDWRFGKGRNDYLSQNKAVIQDISTRLNMFLGDCFFASADGIDWFNLLGSKNELALQLSVRTTILNTVGVKGLVSLAIFIDPSSRRITMTYTVNTIYTQNNNLLAIPASSSFLLTEGGDVLTSEDGLGLQLG